MAPGHSFTASLGDLPETSTDPSIGFRTPRIRSAKDVFPDPEGPTMAINSPRLISKLTLLRIGTSESLYEKLTSCSRTTGSNPL